MRRLALLLAGAAVWLLLAVPVFADNGPHHAGAGATPDSCAGCHRAHTGVGANLLNQSSETALCTSCHGDTSTGSSENVMGGVAYNGTTGALRGGGFTDAALDVTLANSVSGNPGGTAGIAVLGTALASNSKHLVDTSGTLWGNGALGTTGAGGAVTITCTSCHDPHGNGNYRILRSTPNVTGASGIVTIADAATHTYTTTDYWHPEDTNDAAYIANVSAWCSTCHTRYLAASGLIPERTTSTDAIFTYRHRTDGAGGPTDNLSYQSPQFTPTCVQCHVAHGSNAANVGPNSQAVPWPGTTTARATDSSLLRINDRGVCQKCHKR